MNRTIRAVLCTGTILGLAYATPVQADITGSIDVTLTLEGGCVVNGTNTADGSTGANFGLLDFGTQTTLFTQADSQVTGAGGGISVQCTTGVAPVLEFGTGQYDGSVPGTTHAMLNASVPGQYVGYNLYSDAGRTDVITPGETIGLATDGSVQVVNVYGRAFGAAGLSPGTYNDVVTVTLQL